MWKLSLGVGLCCGLGLIACGESDKNGPGSATAGTMAMAGGSGGSAGASTTAGAPSGGSGGTSQQPDPTAREYRGIVNIVDADCAREHDEFFSDIDPFLGGMGEHALSECTRRFYAHYADEYDFLFVINDHPIDSPAVGLHSWVNKPPLPGTGDPEPTCSEDGPPHLRSVVGIQVPRLDDYFPPFAHELMHHFAVHFADELGVSHDVDTEFRGHWGMVSANGQMGGFDATTLQCETPAGQKPPGCTALPSGRYRYTVAQFFPNTKTNVNQPYSPIELYLMGLIPKEQVEPLLRFDGADFKFENPELTADGKLVIDATGITEIPISQIVAVQGEVPLLPEAQRHFKAAVMLITAQPASQQYLDAVADWAASFSGEQASPKYSSFSTLTGGRATLSMKLGARHDLGPGEALEFGCLSFKGCDPYAQDCAGGQGCYGTSSFYCAKPGTLDTGSDCQADNDCKPGLICTEIPTNFERRVCSPYCDDQSDTAANACAKLCPDGTNPIFDNQTLEVLGAFCHGGAGGACNPLTQDCAAGQACTGVETVSCAIPGDTKLGQVCLPFGATCEKGSVCVGVQGQQDQFCQPYCDPAPGAAANACTTLCPKGAWEYSGYGVCIP